MSLTDYIKSQKESGLKIGDKVKILRTAEKGENEWDNSWIPEDMDWFIGKTHIITDINSSGIFTDQSDGYSFPYFVLEKIN